MLTQNPFDILHHLKFKNFFHVNVQWAFGSYNLDFPSSVNFILQQRIILSILTLQFLLHSLENIGFCCVQNERKLTEIFYSVSRGPTPRTRRWPK